MISLGKPALFLKENTGAVDIKGEARWEEYWGKYKLFDF